MNSKNLHDHFTLGLLEINVVVFVLIQIQNGLGVVLIYYTNKVVIIKNLPT